MATINDFGGFLSIAPELLRQLPAILQAAQYIAYFFFIMFFGSLIVKGYTGYMGAGIRFGLRLLTGFAALISGISISQFLPFFNSGIYRIFQMHIIAGGLVATAALAAAVYLISHNIFNVDGMKRQIEKMQTKIKKSEELKSKGIRTSATDPIRIAGIALVVALLGFSIATFRGFPDIFADLGFSSQDLENIASQIEAVSGSQLPEGCISIPTLAAAYGTNLLKNPYNSSEVKAIIESGSGSTIAAMYSVNYSGQTMVLAPASDNRLCSATTSRFCECIALSQ